ncbi:helix-turn-helix protein [Nocardia amikacinitolerans]|uniref:helix-turn-helix domain-containing protein n=1 Tax=Nocardia amikacinitolerans TaxID=756689 RepID=UPI0008307C66|nr:XRE family transcriptional regulator [Nocardia amikacinitolerans]MCP2321250.1 helix-turn-helix protein [Nocardia amikacinitolerans]
MYIKSDGRPNENELVARNVRRYRLERVMSLGELARRSGLSKQTLSKIEQGVGNPTIETLSQLGAALDVTARRLLTEWGTPVYVQRAAESEWSEAANWSERMLDETYGSGYVRTLVLRLERTGTEPEVVEPHAPGTLHHIYVISGKFRTGPLNDTVDLAAGDFVRFPGDVPHRHLCLSERVVAHMVTTIPQVRQFGPPVTRGAHGPGAADVLDR